MEMPSPVVAAQDSARGLRLVQQMFRPKRRPKSNDGPDAVEAWLGMDAGTCCAEGVQYFCQTRLQTESRNDCMLYMTCLAKYCLYACHADRVHRPAHSTILVCGQPRRALDPFHGVVRPPCPVVCIICPGGGGGDAGVLK